MEQASVYLLPQDAERLHLYFSWIFQVYLPAIFAVLILLLSLYLLLSCI